MGAERAVETVEGIVLGHADLGESDRIVRLLTADRGLVEAVARGARTSRRRFGGALDAGVRVLAQVERPRRADGLAVLLEADVRVAPHRIREDYARLVYAAHGCEVARALSEPGVPAERLYLWLGVWLDRLEGEAAPSVAMRLAGEAKALTFTGLAPALVTCPVCGRTLGGAVAFSPEDGGGVHVGCGSGRPVLAEDLAAIERLRRTPLHEVADERVPREVRGLLVDFVEHHTRRPLRTREMVSMLEAS